MRMIRYQVMGYTIIYDPVTEQEYRQEAPATIEQTWNERAEAYARTVAVGDVETYDDGEENNAVTTDDVVNALLGVE